MREMNTHGGEERRTTEGYREPYDTTKYWSRAR